MTIRPLARLLASTAIVLLSAAGAALPRATIVPHRRDAPGLAFSSNRGTAPAVYSVNLDGGGLRRLTPLDRYAGYPVLSADGSRIALPPSAT